MNRLIKKCAIDVSKEKLLNAIERNNSCEYEGNDYYYLCPYDGFFYNLGDVYWDSTEFNNPYVGGIGHYDFGRINIGADMEFIIKNDTIEAFLYHDGHTFKGNMTYEEMINLLKTDILPEYSEELRNYLEEHTEPKYEPDHDEEWENRFDEEWNNRFDSYRL